MLPRRSLLALFALLPVLACAAPLAVDPASVAITVGARATMHGFTGRLATAAIALEGDVTSGAITSASVRFRWSDLKTGDAARDKEMVAWATAKSAEGTFLLVSLAPTPVATTFTATGSLALNGQTRDVSFPVTIVRTPAGWDVTGETTIDHRDWGLPKIRKFGMLTVDPNVSIRFHLSATPGA